MIKIIHTADIHLGKGFPSMGEKGKEYRSQLLRTFDRIIDLVIDENASLLIIAGDLFDSNFIAGIVIGRVSSGFARLQSRGIPVCILPGTHDSYNDDSIYRFVSFPPNVTIFTRDQNKVVYNNLDLAVYGQAYSGKISGESPLQGLSVSCDSKYNVGIAHCSIRIEGLVENDSIILNKKEIAGSGLDYLALGHWHSFQDFSQGDTKAFFCGSPEPISMDDIGSGNVAVITIHEKGNIEVKPAHVGTKRFDKLDIDAGSVKSLGDIIEMIKARADSNLILEVTLSGLSSMNYALSSEDIEAHLNKEFFCLHVIDKSHLTNAIKVEDVPEKTVAGRFVRIMMKRIDSAMNESDKQIGEEALKTGLLLLQGHPEVIE